MAAWKKDYDYLVCLLQTLSQQRTDRQSRSEDDWYTPQLDWHTITSRRIRVSVYVPDRYDLLERVSDTAILQEFLRIPTNFDIRRFKRVAVIGGDEVLLED